MGTVFHFIAQFVSTAGGVALLVISVYQWWVSKRKRQSFGQRLLRIGLSEQLGDTLAGDMAEEFLDRRATHGRMAALFWYWGQVGRSVVAMLWSRMTHGALDWIVQRISR